MASVKTVDVLIADMRVLIFQLDTATPLTAGSPAVLDLITVLQSANAQTPLSKFDCAAEFAERGGGGAIVRWHYWAGARVGDGEWSRQWEAGKILSNVPGRASLAQLESLGLVGVRAMWGQA